MNADEAVFRRFDELISRGRELEDSGTTLAQGDLNAEVPAAGGWAAACLDFIAEVFGKDSGHWEWWHGTYGSAHQLTYLRRCVEHLQEARADYEAKARYRVRGLLRAKVFTDVLEIADHYLDVAAHLTNGQGEDVARQAAMAAAAFTATSVLEMSVRNLFHDRLGEPRQKRGKIQGMSDRLFKGNVYDDAQHKLILAWAAIRDAADHGRWHDLDAARVKNMVDGVRVFVRKYAP